MSLTLTAILALAIALVAAAGSRWARRARLRPVADDLAPADYGDGGGHGRASQWGRD